MSAVIDKLHDKARRAIQAGEHKFREAAEYLAEASKRGATQRHTAKAIGKSPAWVNALLKWRKAGYKDTPFGPQSMAKRAVQATEQKPRQPMSPAHAMAVRAKAEAAKAKAEFQTARAVAVAKMFGVETKRVPKGARKELLKALAMLGSEHAAERASAALIVERQRARLNLTWNDLIIPAEIEDDLSEAA